VDQEAPATIRNSAQALFAFLTYGLGMWVGSEFSGLVFNHYTAGNYTNWYAFWMVPSVGVLIAYGIFMLCFREKRRQPATQDQDALLVEAAWASSQDQPADRPRG
jgi:hypothetical protein